MKLRDLFPNSSINRDKFIAMFFPDNKSVLDVGCGDGYNMRFFNGKKDGVEIYQPSIEKLEGYGKIWKLDVRDLSSIPDKSYDIVAAFHLIEHLTKKDGYNLLKEMERIAREKILIETPNGFLPQEPYGGNRYQKHLSGWNVQNLKELGYSVYGLYGLKYIWTPLKHFTDKSIRLHPFASHIILGIKTLN